MTSTPPEQGHQEEDTGTKKPQKNKVTVDVTEENNRKKLIEKPMNRVMNA